jgi:Secretion system C-terminal sorting domain
MSTTAHEFQHMINYNYNKAHPQITFINESCSKLAEVYCGYPTSDLDLYANETNHYLFDWRTNDNTLVLNDYARAQRFSLYLWDRFGIGIFKYVVQGSQTSGTGIVSDALSKDGTGLDLNSLFSDWLIANELNDTTSNRMYGYAYPNLPLSNGKNFYNPNTSGTDVVQNLGAEYLLFKAGSNLNATFTNTGGNPNLLVKAIEVGSGVKNVVDVPLGTAFSEPNFGSTYSAIAFVVINEDPNNSAQYSYSVTGVAPTTVTELKWDDTEPVGYYPWITTSDTLCVTFDAYPQGVLDSVRVALRRAGSLEGGVYQFTGKQTPTPLGQLLTPMTATISTTSQVPYPEPYQNWTGIDLTSKKISTDNPFAVAFVIGNDPITPGVLVAEHIGGTGQYHSYTYLRTSDPGVTTEGWYYLGSSDTTDIYLIRAYVSLVTGIKQAVELSPTNFGLSQNYPNPFNPTTTINYQLSTSGHVTLKVFDVLGREVATLVNAHQSVGIHSVAFNAGNLPSGVYFYRITAGSFSEVRKLILEK